MMKILQSKSGNNYEFDPSANPISENGYWLCFDGYRLSDMMSMPIVIYFIRPEVEEIAENLLVWLNNIPKSVFNHPNIICPIDYVEETEHVSGMKGTVKCLYIIRTAYDYVSLSELMQDLTNRKSVEFYPQMCKLYKSDKKSFVKGLVVEILRVLENLHNLGINIGCIDPDFILLTKDNKIKINFIEIFHWHRVKLAAYSQNVNSKNIVIELIGAINGKYRVMVAPELLYGYNDARMDIYSIGVLLFYILTGHLPHYSDDDIIVPFNQEMSLHEIKDKQLRRIVKKATENNFTKRYQSAREFIVALDSIEKVQIPWRKKVYRFFHKNKCILSILPSILFTLYFCPNSNAQNTMRINYKDGSVYDTPIERVDSITFIEKALDGHYDVMLAGEWFWGNKEKGYYEVLTFNEDKTYTGYDNYFTYGFDTMTYGWYVQFGSMLTLQSNGYGYRRTYRWFVTALTENALEVMTQMGGFTYYRVQPELYSLKVGEESHECFGGDYYVFTDGTKVSNSEERLKGISEGVSYILKYDAKSGLIMAYQVIVE